MAIFYVGENVLFSNRDFFLHMFLSGGGGQMSPVEGLNISAALIPYYLLSSRKMLVPSEQKLQGPSHGSAMLSFPSAKR